MTRDSLLSETDASRLDFDSLTAGAVGTLLNKTCLDVDELESQITEGDVKLTQLALEAFRCETLRLNFGTVWIHFSRLNVPVRVVGDRNPDYRCFVCLPHGIERPVVSHKVAITDDFLFGFDLHREVDMVFPKDTTHCAISIREDVFQTCIQALGRSDLTARRLANNYVYAPETSPPLKAYLDQLYRLMQQRSPIVTSPNYQQLILKDLVPMLIAAIPLQEDCSQLQLPALPRAELMKQAEDYMQAHLDAPLTLADLCEALYVSRRTMFYCFEQIFGLSPMAYLKSMRLRGVRSALKVADPETATVRAIAQRFGFYSLGHFARDYKTMFGEKPSETLSGSKFG